MVIGWLLFCAKFTRPTFHSCPVTVTHWGVFLSLSLSLVWAASLSGWVSFHPSQVSVSPIKWEWWQRISSVEFRPRWKLTWRTLIAEGVGFTFVGVRSKVSVSFRFVQKRNCNENGNLFATLSGCAIFSSFGLTGTGQDDLMMTRTGRFSGERLNQSFLSTISVCVWDQTRHQVKLPL